MYVDIWWGAVSTSCHWLCWVYLDPRTVT